SLAEWLPMAAPEALPTPRISVNASPHALLRVTQGETFLDRRQVHRGNGLLRRPRGPLIPENEPCLDPREADGAVHVDVRPRVVGAVEHPDDSLRENGRGKVSCGLKHSLHAPSKEALASP